MLTRKRVPELMDDPALDYSSHAEALKGLERLNFFSTSAASLWQQIKPCVQQERAQKRLRVLDIATGGGDIPVALYKTAKAEGIDIEISGADISPSSIKYATQYAQQRKAPVKFIELNALHDQLPEGFDVVMTNLFTHHLDPADVINLLNKMAGCASQLVLVNDLVRSEISYAMVWLATRIFSRSPIVHYDGPVSVRASYTAQEFLRMANQAGLEKATVNACPPCRQLLIWKPDA
jgi:2-polyprenyl-3-methyl-5-hydroxy-6-metoxy-1,4-benzoquinol methylase